MCNYPYTEQSVHSGDKINGGTVKNEEAPAVWKDLAMKGVRAAPGQTLLCSIPCYPG